MRLIAFPSGVQAREVQRAGEPPTHVSPELEGRLKLLETGVQSLAAQLDSVRAAFRDEANAIRALIKLPNDSAVAVSLEQLRQEIDAAQESWTTQWAKSEASRPKALSPENLQEHLEGVRKEMEQLIFKGNAARVLGVSPDELRKAMESMQKSVSEGVQKLESERPAAVTPDAMRSQLETLQKSMMQMMKASEEALKKEWENRPVTTAMPKPSANPPSWQGWDGEWQAQMKTMRALQNEWAPQAASVTPPASAPAPEAFSQGQLTVQPIAIVSEDTRPQPVFVEEEPRQPPTWNPIGESSDFQTVESDELQDERPPLAPFERPSLLKRVWRSLNKPAIRL